MSSSMFDRSMIEDMLPEVYCLRCEKLGNSKKLFICTKCGVPIACDGCYEAAKSELPRILCRCQPKSP